MCFRGPLRLGIEIDVIITLPQYVTEVERYLADNSLSNQVRVLTHGMFAAAGSDS